jgi:homoaconitate hydratase
MPQNLTEKIVQKYASGLEKGQEVHSGDYIMIQPAYVMTHDNTGAVIPKFKSIGATQMANPRQAVHTLDHNIQDTSEKNLEKYAKIEAFSRSMGVDFYPAGRGIGHQIMCEEGYAWPGTIVVASDSHSNMYGGLGCLGTPIVRTDAAAIWATGKTWWQVPPVAKVELRGKLKPGVSGKDVIITLCGFFNHDEALNHAIEFNGTGIKNLSIEQRLTIANMTTEWGALAGIFPTDEVTISWLKQRAEFVGKRGLAGVPSDADGQDHRHPRLNEKRLRELEQNILHPDKNAFYAKHIVLDLSTIQPYVAGPNSVKVMTPIQDIEKKNIKINKAYLVSCVNSRLDDLAEAAAIVRGKKIAGGVEFYIAAASSEIQQQSERQGDWQTLLSAGAIPLPPGCGPCIGLGKGLLQDGEVGISATNRNFKGRMGSRNADTYLASPAVVAASALAGKITYPFQGKISKIKGTLTITKTRIKQRSAVKIITGFPETIQGELLFCYQDNLNTDGIYPGKYTYLDDFTPRQQAEVVMENYDPEFKTLVRTGDLLSGGFNFGTGSSREQAATALKYCGLQLVIAGSFNETYKRNALNNGFLVIEAAQLIKDLKNKFGEKQLTVRTALQVTVDFRLSEIRTPAGTYAIDPIGTAAQELIVSGGLENWVKKQLTH